MGSSDEGKTPWHHERSNRAKTRMVLLRHVDQVSGSVVAGAAVAASARQVYCVWRRQSHEGGVEGALFDCAEFRVHNTSRIFYRTAILSPR